MPEKNREEKVTDLAYHIACVFGKEFPLPKAFEIYRNGLLDIFRDIPFDHPKYGEINDLDWITKEITNTCFRFPSVREIRDIYKDYLIPMDELKMRGFALDYRMELKREKRERKETSGEVQGEPQQEAG